MIPSCRNCLHCNVIRKDIRVLPNGEMWRNEGLQSYWCYKDNSFKKYDTLCSRWEHKNWLIRKLWRFFND